MKLPGGERAIVDITKLRDYCLSPDHPRGKHKARFFEARLGLMREDAGRLAEALRHAAAESDGAVLRDSDRFGQRYELDFHMTGPGGSATVRSAWIVRTGETVPRLTSCYVR